jgi:hypothetical protein
LLIVLILAASLSAVLSDTAVAGEETAQAVPVAVNASQPEAAPA